MNSKPNSSPAAAESPVAGRESKSGFSVWIWVLILLLLVYPLSIGPTALIAKRFPKAETGLSIIYAPVIWLAEQSDPFGDLLESYLGLWGVEVDAAP